jgi:CRISPR-associated protein Cas2
MLMLISYDVSTATLAGQRRLRRVAKACQDFGTRVQYSVFECHIDSAQWVKLRARHEKIIDPAADSLRCYNLGSHYGEKVLHIGAKPVPDPETDLLSI